MFGGGQHKRKEDHSPSSRVERTDFSIITRPLKLCVFRPEQDHYGNDRGAASNDALRKGSPGETIASTTSTATAAANLYNSGMFVEDFWIIKQRDFRE